MSKFKSDISFSVKIGDVEFMFPSRSEIEAERYDLVIKEPGFDEKSEKIEKSFTSTKIILPVEIEAEIERTRLLPCSKIWKDNEGRKKLSTYFD